MQPNTTVGLNTGRPESIREETRRCLNKLGYDFKVDFTDDLLYMHPDNWGDNVPLAKVAGVRYFQDMGYHVFAFVDNEPDNLELIANIDPDHEILLLHADTIFNSKRTQLTPRTITFDLDFPEWHYFTPAAAGNFGDNHEIFVQEVSLV